MAKRSMPRLLPVAKRDVKAGFAWYEKQKRGLGHVFLERVEECLNAIGRSPNAFHPVGNNFRRAVVKKFPYVVFYRVEDKIIYVYAVFQASQDPKKWIDRLSDSPDAD